MLLLYKKIKFFQINPLYGFNVNLLNELYVLINNNSCSFLSYYLLLNFTFIYDEYLSPHKPFLITKIL